MGKSEALMDSVAYTSREIRKRKSKPYQMANEPLAEEMLPYLQKEFPEMRIVKFGIVQWLVKDQRAGKNLEKQLEEMIAKSRKEMDELCQALKVLQDGGCQQSPSRINTGRTAVLSAPK